MFDKAVIWPVTVTVLNESLHHKEQASDPVCLSLIWDWVSKMMCFGTIKNQTIV